MAEDYLRDHRIRELFKSLAVALLHHRPTDPIAFIENALERPPPGGWQNVTFDSFIEVTPTSRLGSAKSPLPSIKPASTKSATRLQRQSGISCSTTEQPIPNVEHHTKTAEGDVPVEEKGDDEDITNTELDSSLRQFSQDSRTAHYQDDKVLSVMRGSLQNLPPLPSKIVRIFLSSTFSDFKAERNILPKKAYPELQQFCQQLGLDFQVMDMRWGVTDDMMNDHQVSELCLREIAICQQVSCGPNFVTLLGNRYGYRPFPAKIEAQEFECLLDYAGQCYPNKWHLLKDWFILDDNSVPSAYVLQPILSKLPDYNNMENDALRTKAIQTWNKIHDDIRMMLSDAARKAVKDKKLLMEKEAKYTISVTEDEIRAGMLNASNANSKTLCYIRNFKGLLEEGYRINPDSPIVNKFIDLTKDKELDQEAHESLNQLKTVKIPQKINCRGQKEFSTAWTGTALEESEDVEHQQYLQTFCSNFVNDMKEMITDANGNNKKDLDDDPLYFEVLHHARFAIQKLKVFCGREDVLEILKNKIQFTEEPNTPLIVHGHSGYGKTSLMAKIASQIHSWFGPDTIIVTRFLGTSPSSSNILTMLLSVMNQLGALLDFTLPAEEKMSRMGEVRQHLIKVFEFIEKLHKSRKIVMILDSIDQLTDINGAHQMSWLPTTLPPNIQVVVSMLSDRYKCLSNMQQRLPKIERYIALKPLEADTGGAIIESFMAYHNRNVNDQQRQLIADSFLKNGNPLFLKLVLDEALKWCSYTKISADVLPQSVEGAILSLFDELEVKYGLVFVQHSLGYMTCGNGGLSGIEMEDILSCDDDVLNEVYKYHDPPLEGTIRIPSLLWARLENELLEYLVKRNVDGKTVMTWYHRQFWEVAENKFLEKFQAKKLHSRLADLFGQVDGIKKTIILHQRKGKTIESADRRVTPQMLTRKNLRKLNALPYHLLWSDNMAQLKRMCALDFEFLLEKLHACGINTLYNEYRDFCKHDDAQNHEDLLLFKDFLQIAYSPLSCDANLLALYVTQMFKTYRCQFELIDSLCRDAEDWLHKTSLPLLIPLHKSYTPIDSVIKFKQMVGMDGIMTPNKKVVISNWHERYVNTHKINVFDIETRDILVSQVVQRKSPFAVTADSRFFFHFYGVDGVLYMKEVASGDVFETWTFDDESEQVNGRDIALSNSGQYLAFTFKTGKPKIKANVWRNITKICMVDLEHRNGPLQSISVNTKKPVDKLYFSADDECVIAISKTLLLVLSVPDLSQVHAFKEGSGFHGSCSCLDIDSKTVVIGTQLKKGVRFTLYDYKNNTVLSGPSVNTNESIEPYGICVKQGLEQVILGGNVNTKDFRRSFVWIWDKQNSKDWSVYQEVPTGVGAWAVPTSLITDSNWEFCILGWNTGEISIVKINEAKEIFKIEAHGHAVPFLELYDDGTKMVSMGIDHSLLIWDVVGLLNQAVKEAHTFPITQSIINSNCLDIDVQVVNMAVTDSYAITAGELNKECPKFWDLSTGAKLVDLTEEYQQKYLNFLPTLDIEFNRRYHADVAVTGDTNLVYIRKRRNACAVFVFSLKCSELLAGKWYTDCFYQLPIPSRIAAKTNPHIDMLLLRDGEMEAVEFPYLNSVFSCETQSILNEFEDINTSNAKRQLLMYNFAISVDGKYGLFINPIGKQNGLVNKYMDWFDLQNKTLIERVKLPKDSRHSILKFSICYLVTYASKPPQILKPSDVNNSKHVTYQCLLFADSTIVSEDFCLGVELINGSRIRIWNTNTVTRHSTLDGHTAEVNCGRFSADNRFLATGSYDNTCRLWDVVSGTQMCLFHAAGSVDSVRFTPNMKYLVVNHYYGPQRKRGTIVHIKNLYEKDS